MPVTDAKLRIFLREAEALLAPLRAARRQNQQPALCMAKGGLTSRSRWTSQNPDIARLHEILAVNGGLIPGAVTELMREVGARGTGRHNLNLSIAGYLTAHRWAARDIVTLLARAANAHFSEGDWTAEITRQVEYAQERQAQQFQNSGIYSGGLGGT